MPKCIFFLFLCLILMQFQAYANPQQQESQLNGRYQICTSMSGSRSEVYLLDTQTGQVWTLTNNFGSLSPWIRLPLPQR